MKKVSLDGLLALKPEEIKLVYLRCLGNTMENSAKKLGFSPATAYKKLKEDVYPMLGVEGWRDINADLCKPLRKMVSSVEELENWPEGFREKIEALRKPQESKNEEPSNQDSTSTTRSVPPTNGIQENGNGEGNQRESERRSIPWYLFAIPMLIVCLFCIPGVLLGRQFVRALFENGGIPFSQATPTMTAPTETPTLPPTNTKPVVFTQTSSPTLTYTPLLPTPTSPSPTFTLTPTETPTPKPPALFETSFDSGMPEGMEMVYGDIDFVDGELLAHELTLLSIGEDTWKNYQVEYETRKHTYCWGLKNNGIAAHATDSENMIVWSWNYCEAGWFELVNGDWVKITGSKSVGVDPGKFVTIRLVAENGNFTVYANNIKRTSYYDEKYTQGKVYILLGNQSIIDNIYISLLP